MNAQGQHFIVAGAGIGGLAAALGLMGAGQTVTILEAAPQLAEIGAGISISPNAALALGYLGLADRLKEASDRPTRSAVLHYRTGEILSESDFGQDFKSKYGEEYYQLHRADLHEALTAAVNEQAPDCIRLGHQVTDIEETADGVTVTCKDGQTLSCDYVIGSDGLRSAVRESCVSKSNPRWTGQVAYRALVPIDAVKERLHDLPSGVTVGPGHIVTRYLIRQGTVLNLVALAQSDAWKEEGWSHPATTEELLAEHDGWNEDIQTFIKAAPEAELFKWALFDRDPLPQWTTDRVALLGDAAHPMLPFLGMGAAMALEDAVILSRCVEAYADTSHAFKVYQETRKDRADETMLDSRMQGQFLQSSDPDAVDWGNMQTDESAEWKRFSYDPATADLIEPRPAA